MCQDPGPSLLWAGRQNFHKLEELVHGLQLPQVPFVFSLVFFVRTFYPPLVLQYLQLAGSADHDSHNSNKTIHIVAAIMTIMIMVSIVIIIAITTIAIIMLFCGVHHYCRHCSIQKASGSVLPSSRVIPRLGLHCFERVLKLAWRSHV